MHLEVYAVLSLNKNLKILSVCSSSPLELLDPFWQKFPWQIANPTDTRKVLQASKQIWFDFLGRLWITGDTCSPATSTQTLVKITKRNSPFILFLFFFQTPNKLWHVKFPLCLLCLTGFWAPRSIATPPGKRRDCMYV